MNTAPPLAASTAPTPTPRSELKPSQRAAIVALSLVSPKTVARWCRGDRVQPVIEERIQRAAVQLGFWVA